MKSIKINKGAEDINLEIFYKASSKSLANIRAFSTINSFSLFDIKSLKFHTDNKELFIIFNRFDRGYS